MLLLDKLLYVLVLGGAELLCMFLLGAAKLLCVILLGDPDLLCRGLPSSHPALAPLAFGCGALRPDSCCGEEPVLEPFLH